MNWRTTSITVLLTGCAGCASTPMTVRDGAPLPEDRFTTPVKPFCILEVREITDQRQDRSLLGTVRGRDVRTPEGSDDWLRNELQALAPLGVALQYGRASQNFALPNLQAKITLISAGISGEGLSKTAAVAMSFDYQRAGKTISTATYRGRNRSFNLIATDTAIQRTLDEAFDQVMDDVQLDVKRLCVPRSSS